MVVDNVDAKDARSHSSKKTLATRLVILTDEAGQYCHIDENFADHEVDCPIPKANMSLLNDRTIHVNCCENYFKHLQAWHEGHLSALGKKQHLHRYLAEFDFRYNNRCSRPKTKKRPAREGLNDVQKSRSAA